MALTSSCPQNHLHRLIKIEHGRGVGRSRPAVGAEANQAHLTSQHRVFIQTEAKAGRGNG